VFGARALSTSWTLPDGGKPRFIGISSTECCVLCLGRNISWASGSGYLTDPLAKLDTLEKLHVYDLNSPSGSPPISTVLVPKGVKYVHRPLSRFAGSNRASSFLSIPSGHNHVSNGVRALYMSPNILLACSSFSHIRMVLFIPTMSPG